LLTDPPSRHIQHFFHIHWAVGIFNFSVHHVQRLEQLLLQSVLSADDGQASSEAVNVNAAASYFGIGGSVGVDTSKTQLSETQFSTFKSTQSAFRQTACGFSNAVSSLSSVIDPSVSASYTSCLNIYATGIQVTQTTGVASKSLSLDKQFVTNNLGAKAYMTGLTVNGPATCRLKGFSLPKGAATTFHFKLTVDAVYTLVCQLASSAKADGGITDVLCPPHLVEHIMRYSFTLLLPTNSMTFELN